jgi:hypothetical protein
VSDATPPPDIPVPEPGRYRHFKGNEYEVLSLARHSEDLSWLVVYRRVAEPDSIWVRPLVMFLEVVERPDGPVQRFTPIDA